MGCRVVFARYTIANLDSIILIIILNKYIIHNIYYTGKKLHAYLSLLSLPLFLVICYIVVYASVVSLGFIKRSRGEDIHQSCVSDKMRDK